MSKKKKDVSLEISPRFRNFNWEKAKIFYYVAKSGSFTKASALLNISQSALSRSVMEIEETLEAQLFVREARGVRLTRKGEELLPVVENMFLGMSDFTRKVYAETHHGKKRKIRIASTHAIIAYILDTHILSYNTMHPDLIFELISDDHLIDIVLNDVDIAIRPYDPHARNIQQDPLFTLEKKLYASPEYLQKYGEPKTVEDLKNHCLISFARPEELPYADVNWILRLGKNKGELYEPIFTSTSIESVVKAAIAGKGIIGSYEKMEIIENSVLKNILPNIKDKKVDWRLIYPASLIGDKQLMDLKNYLFSKMSSK